jgi:O-antigen/teichoic acid export membrane protein
LGNIYNSYLQGLNQIALLRRWEIVFSLAAIATSFIVLLLNGGLLGLVAVNQGWLIINILRNRWLSRLVEQGRFKTFTRKGKDEVVLSAVWPSAWRSGLGVFMSYGLVQISGVIYAQFGSASGVASYLMGLRLIQMVSQFSQAPFYSKLPLLAQRRASGNLKEQVRIAQKGMKLAYWTYVAGFVSLGFLGKPLLGLIGSNADFPDSGLWCLMGLAIFAERYGAMHIQLYSITNHIIWHIANSVSGTIYIAISMTLFSYIGVYAFPLALLISYLGFYCWYSARYSYKAFELLFWSFERKVAIIPFCVMLSFCVVLMLVQHL